MRSLELNGRVEVGDKTLAWRRVLSAQVTLVPLFPGNIHMNSQTG